jgi:hypothetical protein
LSAFLFSGKELLPVVLLAIILITIHCIISHELLKSKFKRFDAVPLTKSCCCKVFQGTCLAPAASSICLIVLQLQQSQP